MKLNTLLTTTEVMKLTKTTRPTAISWLRNWEVDGLPIGIKRGGRWFAFPDRLIQFLQGNGTRKNMSNGGSATA